MYGILLLLKQKLWILREGRKTKWASWLGWSDVLAYISLKALKFVKTQSQQKMKGETENGINILKFVIFFSSFKKNKEFFFIKLPEISILYVSFLVSLCTVEHWVERIFRFNRKPFKEIYESTRFGSHITNWSNWIFCKWTVELQFVILESWKKQIKCLLVPIEDLYRGNSRMIVYPNLSWIKLMFWRY